MDNQNENTIDLIPVDSLVPYENQPRKYIDDEQIESLAASIKKYGVLQPLKYIIREGKNIILSGHARTEAAKRIGLSTIPAIQISATDNIDIIALLENISQKGLLPMEEALALNTLLQNTNMGQNELAESLGIPISSMSEKLKLIKLPQYIQDEVLLKPDWPAYKLRQLADITDEEHRRILFEKMKKAIEKKNQEDIKEKIKYKKLNKDEKWNRKIEGLCKATANFKESLGERLKKMVSREEMIELEPQIQQISVAIDNLINGLRKDRDKQALDLPVDNSASGSTKK